jgi:hypothetical protein
MNNAQKEYKNEEELMSEFGKLSPEELICLYKAPVLVSVLAASSDNKINKAQKEEALKLAHLKTFTARIQLLFYYKEVEKHFKENFESLEKQFYPFDRAQREALQHEIANVNHVINKLDKNLARILHESLNKYANHVKKSGVGILDDIIFPLPINGLNQ